jgi:signal transduction histidine kinase
MTLICGRIDGVEERAVRAGDRSRAALAVENERLQQALRARLEEERALRRVATLVAQEHAPELVLAVVAEEVARHLGADGALIARYDGPDRATVVADWGGPGFAPIPVGSQIELKSESALARVRATLAPTRVDSYEGMPGEYPAQLRALGMRASVAAPVLVDGQQWGAVAAGSAAGPFTADAEARLAAFAELVAQAIANVDARLKLSASRARIVEAADEARRRIERDLHDGAQQRLVSIALSLRLAATRAEPATATAIEHCIDELMTALAELRDLARGLHPAVLTEHGLLPALGMLASRSTVPVGLDSDLEGRLPPAHETALYFVAAEALTNVAKYARASSATVTLRRDGQWAEIAVADDGVGGVDPEHGSGLRGLADRVEALGGRLTVASAPGKGTTVRARVPIATDSADTVSNITGQTVNVLTV